MTAVMHLDIQILVEAAYNEIVSHFLWSRLKNKLTE